MMKNIDNIEFTIYRFPKGFVFTYSSFDTQVISQESVIKSLNRLVTSGKICKLSKGKFYKAEKSEFGILPPTQYQVVKDLLEKDGKIVGYITGYGAFNELGLTTQVSNTIQIGKNEIRSAFKRGIYKISFIKQKNNINKDNIRFLKILDAIKNIKNIPDSTLESSCSRLLVLLQQLSPKELESTSKLALNYPPSTRALLGALMEQSIGIGYTDNLKKSLNKISVYKLSISEKILPTAKNWNIQ